MNNSIMMDIIISLTLVFIYYLYTRFDKGSDKYWTGVADNFLRYKRNGWNTDKKFSEEKILEKQKKYKQKYKIY